MRSERTEQEKANDPTRAVLWALAQGVREAIREDSGPREESIALPFLVEKLIDTAEKRIRELEATPARGWCCWMSGGW